MYNTKSSWSCTSIPFKIFKISHLLPNYKSHLTLFEIFFKAYKGLDAVFVN